VRSQLDPDTLLVEYALEEKKSFAWVVGRDRLKSFDLAEEAIVAAAVKNVYQRVVGRDSAADAAIRELSRLVIAPLEGELGSKRLVIVSDGVLESIPFSLLDTNRSGPYRPLMADHEVVALPSASTIDALRYQISGRPAAPKTIAVFADPVFALTDERLSSKPEGAAVSATRILEHTAAEGSPTGFAGKPIPRLPFTQDESKRIAALVPGGQRLDAVGFGATRKLAMSPELGQYRYVHFATHGWLDSEIPERSSLVLSLIDAQGAEQDGFLRSSDISRLRLSADLVTLSACQTGVGKQIAGEGMLSLTRSFLHAGAARVVVSYWNVNDEATAELMGAFYKRMLRQGTRPAAALRAAQMELFRGKRWSSPYFWAAFMLQGEWR
jgi:CHAT domain-containing protein